MIVTATAGIAMRMMIVMIVVMSVMMIVVMSVVMSGPRCCEHGGERA
jgi:hypothetical protein